MARIELKKCPFCGSEVDTVSVKEKDGNLNIEVKRKDRWIPCSERLPYGGNRVLATTKHGYVVDVMFVLKGSQWFRNGEYFPTDTVIAWMPMPDAYEPHEKE